MSIEDLEARFADRFDQRIADGMLAQANEHITGLPKYLGIQITGVGPGVVRR